MQEDSGEIHIVSISDSSHIDGIFKFENCKYRHRDIIIKNTSCCSAQKVSGYYCTKINKFPVNFSTDCDKCVVFEQE